MEILALIVAGVALLFSLFTYFKHDKSLKKQAALINKYQLEKIEKDKEESKKAIIEAVIIKEKPSIRIIKVSNKGKSIAKSVNVIISPSNLYDVLENPCPIDIRPMNSIEITLMVFANRPDKITLHFKWNDNFKLDNTDSQELQLL